MQRLSMKVWVVVTCLITSAPALAFNSLSCRGDLDVRLKGPRAKGDRVVQNFTIKKIEALELEISSGGVKVGRLFPWDHVVWDVDPAAPKNLKFKTDDSKLIHLSFTSPDGKAHKLNCVFDF